MVAGAVGAGVTGPDGQMFADAAGTTVEVPDADETGCWGVALCAAIGTGLHDSFESAGHLTRRIRDRYLPDLRRQDMLKESYERYRAVVGRLADVWPLLAHEDDQ